MKKGENINEVMAIVYHNLQSMTKNSLIRAIRNVKKCYIFDVYDLNQMNIRETKSCAPVVSSIKFFCCCRPCGKNSQFVSSEMDLWIKTVHDNSDPKRALQGILMRDHGKFDFYKDSHHFSLHFLLIKELCNEQLKVSCAMTERDRNRLDGIFVDTDFAGHIKAHTLQWITSMLPTPQQPALGYYAGYLSL